MRRFLLTAFVAVASLTVLATAQTAPRFAAMTQPPAAVAAAATSAQFRLPVEHLGACPVDFSVARRSATDLLEAASGARRPDAQALEIVLRSAEDRRLRSAEIVVHAYTGGPGWLPVRQAGGGQSIIDRSFHVEAGNTGHIRRSLVLDRINGIESVELVALRFADGQSWRAPEGEACRAVPSLYLAVGATGPTATPR